MIGQEIVIDTPQGRLRGSRENGVTAFKGIPYAAPPFGPRRFRAPEPAAPWDGVRDATRFGPTVPKPPYQPPFDQILEEPVIPGEDCLTVNVWTPDPGGSGMPVMVWIHGGAFRNGTGAAELYSGARFARDGVVCVNLNYRLGTDGFALLEGAEANRGLLDQVAALDWVQEHIAAFGGDPGNVTIFGESAGAMSVCSLLSMPRARGRFRRAIAQSGAGHHAQSPASARRVLEALAQRAGLARADLASLAAADVDVLYEQQAALSLEIAMTPDPARWGELVLDGMPFEPVVDGHVLPQRPIDAIAAGAGAEVDVLAGCTTEEWRFFMVPPGILEHITDAHLDARLAAIGADPATIRAAYADVPGSPGDLYALMTTDWFFRVPATRLAEARAGGPGTTHLYEFGWRSPSFDGRMGACHVLEIPFVFDLLDASTATPLVGDAPPQRLADEMHAAWVAFATHGDPGWPAHDLERRPVQHFGDETGLVEDPRAEQRRVWDGLR